MACEVFLRLYTQYMLAHACLRLWPINCQLICRTCKKWATAGSDRVRSIPAWSYTGNIVSTIRAEDNDPIPINVKSVTLRIQRLTRWWGAAPPRGNWRLGSVPVGLGTHTYSTCISVNVFNHIRKTYPSSTVLIIYSSYLKFKFLSLGYLTR